jgi:hypothetical protein
MIGVARKILGLGPPSRWISEFNGQLSMTRLFLKCCQAESDPWQGMKLTP